jgi:hypothetical protein
MRGYIRGRQLKTNALAQGNVGWQTAPPLQIVSGRPKALTF